ncbi:MAG: 2-oxoacid:ferredoxin oxidoreductase subunit beta [Chloroflexi bacterium]|nr:2-oxoacid:ferredoxin oxidoreductase subunit beta [Chloroflexota bacterium]
MTQKNPEYDFKWCPGCGDFGVRRALEFAMAERIESSKLPMETNVVIAGIGCSGNLVHLLEGPQPFGFHGIHGRTLPIALGAKMARPDLNVVVVAGDGDFLSIGMEHIAPQAARNLDVCCVVMDNAVYGLTKGQSAPTTTLGAITSSTPYGKAEEALNPLELYLTLGVTFIAQGFSSKVKDLAKLISAAMAHRGFAIVHVQSPCTTYNDTYDVLKGNPKKSLAPQIWDVPAEHEPSRREAAFQLVQRGGVPLGIIYRQEGRPSLDQRLAQLQERVKPKSVDELMAAYQLS